MARQDGVRQGQVRTRAAAEAELIPDKLYFRIGEVARICAVPSYVLRFWEREFPQLRPGKGGTGQRLYRRRDVEMALRVRGLLYNEGYTIPGARQWLRERTVAEDTAADTGNNGIAEPKRRLREIRAELEEIARLLQAPERRRTVRASEPKRLPLSHKVAGEMTMPLFATLERAGLRDLPQEVEGDER